MALKPLIMIIIFQLVRGQFIVPHKNLKLFFNYPEQFKDSTNFPSYLNYNRLHLDEKNITTTCNEADTTSNNVKSLYIDMTNIYFVNKISILGSNLPTNYYNKLNGVTTISVNIYIGLNLNSLTKVDSFAYKSTFNAFYKKYVSVIAFHRETKFIKIELDMTGAKPEETKVFGHLEICDVEIYGEIKITVLPNSFATNPNLIISGKKLPISDQKKLFDNKYYWAMNSTCVVAGATDTMTIDFDDLKTVQMITLYVYSSENNIPKPVVKVKNVLKEPVLQDGAVFVYLVSAKLNEVNISISSDLKSSKIGVCEIQIQIKDKYNTKLSTQPETLNQAAERILELEIKKMKKFLYTFLVIPFACVVIASLSILVPLLKNLSR